MELNVFKLTQDTVTDGGVEKQTGVLGEELIFTCKTKRIPAVAAGFFSDLKGLVMTNAGPTGSFGVRFLFNNWMIQGMVSRIVGDTRRTEMATYCLTRWDSDKQEFFIPKNPGKGQNLETAQSDRTGNQQAAKFIIAVDGMTTALCDAITTALTGAIDQYVAYLAETAQDEPKVIVKSAKKADGAEAPAPVEEDGVDPFAQS